MIRITRFLYIHILIVPMLILSFILKSQMTFFSAYGIVLIHELSHLLAAVLCNVEVKSIVILPFGMTLRLSPFLIRHPKKEIIIAAAGPLSNVVMLFVASMMLERHGTNLNLLLFIVINAAVLILNLVPVPPLDGGRILRALVIEKSGLIPAVRIMRKISRFFVAMICVLGVLLVVITKGNPSMAIIGAFLVFSLSEEKKNSDMLIAGEMIHEKEKFKNRALIPCETLSVFAYTPAFKVIRKLNLSSFYIVYIVDENLKIIKTATESDFIRAVKNKGYKVLSYEV